MSHSKIAARRLANSPSGAERCRCGQSTVAISPMKCRPCKATACGKMMHSTYDELAHQNHRKLEGMDDKKG